MDTLGYARWENFKTAIGRAVESCETTGYDPDNHFRGVTKMVRLGSGAERATKILDRPLSTNEIAQIEDAVAERIDWFEAIAGAISEKIEES